MDNAQINVSGIRKSLNTQNKAKLDDLNRKIEPLLSRTSNLLTNYTEHTLKHSLGVEQVYDIILDNNFDLLNEEEKYLLIAATLLHDVGMVGRKEELNELGYEEYRRKGHHSFSKMVIKSEAALLNFDRVEANLIADIAEAHRKINLDSLEEHVPSGIGGSVRMRLLGALIRFADELHITNDRSSELLVNVLSPDKFSMKHHKRHLDVVGVNRSIENRKNIEISAIIDDWESEQLMQEMFQEILNKFSEVKAIFDANNIDLDKVEMKYRDEVLVTKEVYLELSSCERTLFELHEKLQNRSNATINKVVSNLVETSLISINDTEKYHLNSDGKTFKTVFNSLMQTENIYKFIDSSYVTNNIGAIFDEIALNIYSHRVFDGDRDDRLLLIKNSPIVLDHLLNMQEMDHTLGQLDRSVILDLLILNGYMQDVAVNPNLSKNDESIFAMQNIQNNIHKHLGSFLRLIQHMDKKTLDESQSRLTESLEDQKKKDDELKQPSISFKSTSKASDLPHTNLMSIYLASAASGESFKIYKDISVTENQNIELIDGEKLEAMDFVQLEFSPQQPDIPLLKNDFWCAIEEDNVNRSLYFKINEKGQNLTEYPFILKLSYYSQTKINFNIECTPFSNASDYLKMILTLEKINALDYRRVYFKDSEDKVFLTSSCPKINKSFNGIEKDILNKIIELEGKLEKSLPLPDELNHNVSLKLDKLLQEIDESNSIHILKKYEELNSRAKLTLLEIELPGSTEEKHFRRIITQSQGWIKYKSLGIKALSSQSSEWNQAVKDQSSIKLRMHFRKYSSEELFSKLMTENSALIKIFGIHREANLSEERLRTFVEIDFESAVDNVQKVKIRIEEIDDRWNDIEELYDTHDYVKLIPYLEEFKIDETTLAYAYVLVERFDEAIRLAKKVVQDDMKSVAHMTIGLAYVGKGDYKAAYDSYFLGTRVCSHPWYPYARDNFINFLQVRGIKLNDDLRDIEKLLSTERSPQSLNSKCYCNSKKKLKKCHANISNF